MSYYADAKKKLTEQLPTVNGRKQEAMKKAVMEALLDFSSKDKEFAQAIVQGGSFRDCMNAVEKGSGNCISDLEAYRKAVQFYFPGADVEFQMQINLCASVDKEQERKFAAKTIQLADFL